MKIIIKNVTGSSANDGLMLELSRAGAPAGTVIEDACYHPANNSCTFTRDGDCVAWLGETCEEVVV